MSNSILVPIDLSVCLQDLVDDYGMYQKFQSVSVLYSPYLFQIEASNVYCLSCAAVFIYFFSVNCIVLHGKLSKSN
jgi:hypothetical protein